MTGITPVNAVYGVSGAYIPPIHQGPAMQQMGNAIAYNLATGNNGTAEISKNYGYRPGHNGTDVGAGADALATATALLMLDKAVTYRSLETMLSPSSLLSK